MKADLRGAGPRLRMARDPDGVTIASPGWQGMRIGPARCAVTLDGVRRVLRLVECKRLRGRGYELQWRAGGVALTQTVSAEGPHRLRWRSRLTNPGQRGFRFDGVELLTVNGIRGARCDFGNELAGVRVLEQNAHRGHVRSVGQILTGVDGRTALDGTAGSFVSNLVTMIYSPSDGRGLLVGFETFDRWYGRIRGGAGPGRGGVAQKPNVDGAVHVGPKMQSSNAALSPRRRLTELSVGFPGAGVPVAPDETLELEEFVIEVGRDPFAMLDDYADRVAARYQVRDLPAPFANACSWYPYRLGVSEDKLLACARIAKDRRLGDLGLRFIQADLGWQIDNIPTYFEENERFGHGLKWLSDRLGDLGFELGVWVGFTCVLEGHEIARRHRDWLVSGDDGEPVVAGDWFWEPHGKIHNLDPTHPEAAEWVRRGIRSLAQRGARYLKWDFGGNVTLPGRQHDPTVARADATEAFRRLAAIVRQEMDSQGAEGIVMDCTGQEVGGVGCFKLSYANADTGNTGVGFGHLSTVYTAFASHMFKNHRWALLQPSCLVVGLPGSLEEARVRATATFLGAGHVDISDDLATLPEDRWNVLLSVLPQNRTPARAVDLYHPVRISSESYEAACRGRAVAPEYTDEPQGANVWHARLEADWDEWDTVAVFNIADPDVESSGTQLPRRFEIPFELFGLDPSASYWAHEFWSGQFLGTIPVPRKPAGAYRHPGDTQALINDSGPGVLDVTFHGPAVKLLAIRKPRRHPWPVGTTFHQSGGMELGKVRWLPKHKTLRGELTRPAGQHGDLILAGIGPARTIEATVAGRRVTPRTGANGSLLVPAMTTADVTEWAVRVR